MPPARIALLISLLPFANLALLAQKPPNPRPANSTAWTEEVVQDFSGPVTTLRTTARLVILDVSVADGNGVPVKGLKASDFILTEDGVPQKLAAFNEYDASTNAPAAPEQPLPPNTFAVHAPPPESVTKTVIVLDQIHYPNYPLVRADIQAFMKTVAPGNPIAIIRLDWQGLHLVEDFTSDPELLQETVAGKRMLPPMPAFPDGGNQCRMPYLGVLNPFHRIARYLAGVPGRINLAWITDEGNDTGNIALEYPDLTNFISNLNGSTNVLRISRVVPYLIKAGGSVGGLLQPLPAADIPLPHIIREPHGDPVPADCPVLPASSGSIFANSDLADIAGAAGGHAFFNGARKALPQILATGSDYYTLSYVPSNPDWNGAFRKIKIKVPSVPDLPLPWSSLILGWTEDNRAKIIYRPGYFANTKPDPRREPLSAAVGVNAQPDSPRKLISVSPKGDPRGPLPPQSTSPADYAMAFGLATPAQLPFTVQVTPSSGAQLPQIGSPAPEIKFLAHTFLDAPCRTYRIHFWIDPQHLKFARTAYGSYRDDLQFIAAVYADDGFVENSISITSHIEIAADDYPNILISGVNFDQTIAIPTQQRQLQKESPAANFFFLRMGVMEASTGHIGAIEVSSESIKLPPAQNLASQ